MTNSTFTHVPVMLKEVMAAIAPNDNKLYIDATFGRGGYARALLETSQATVIGIDQDPDAIKAGQDMVKTFAPRLCLIHGNFGEMEKLLSEKEGLERNKVDGIVFDLGVSSPQLDDASRGFSFQGNGPLDMRMNTQSKGQTAADIVNTATEKELADILFHYGEERYARRIARHIVRARKEEPFTQTSQLATFVRRYVPHSPDGIDRATRTFQGLRIAVNGELDALKKGLHAAETLLESGGTLAVVSFHSLEDRYVKNFLRLRSALSPQSSRHLPSPAQPCAPSFHLSSRKPLMPSEEEISINPRARSARLRIAKRTDAQPFREKAA